MVSYVKCSQCKTESPIQPEANAVRCGNCHTITRIPNCHSTPSLRGGPKAPLPCGRKKAVICGIDYKGTGNDELMACIKDARAMKDLLINRFNFPESNIRLLTEEEKDRRMIPTTENLLNAMSWLVEGVRAGDSLVFHFAGHGSQASDYEGDEIDKFDETICPLDFRTNGDITDDEINEIIVKPIPHGAKLTAIIDACHSGTVLDLPFVYKTVNRKGQYVWDEHCSKSRGWKGTKGGEVIAISACDDHQTSKELKDVPKINYTGAMTYCFLETVRKGQATTYGSLFNGTRTAMRNITMTDEKGINTKLTQELQLSSNRPFDLYARPFDL